MRDQDAGGEDVTDLDELTGELDQEITAAGMRGNVLPARPVLSGHNEPPGAARMRRRCPAGRSPPVPSARPTRHRTARRFRPSMFLTLTPARVTGRVREDLHPSRPG